MTSFEASDALPPAYEEVVNPPMGTGVTPSAPPIAVAVEPISAPLGFETVLHPTPAAVEKEQEASGYGATNRPAVGPGFDPEDDRRDVVLPAVNAAEQRGKREFVIRFTCPSCDCSNLVPHCENLACCSPDLGCLNRLSYLDSKKEGELFPNLTWSKVTDRHMLYFFRKPENVDSFARGLNALIFGVFLLCTTAMFLVSPWAAIIIAAISECDDPTLRPLLGSYGAVALAESFQRLCCYLLNKLDRPKRAIKTLESPNALWVPLLILFIVILTRVSSLEDCSGNNSTLSSNNSTQGTLSNQTLPTTGCCDNLLIQGSIVIPSSWVAFEVVVVALVIVKLIFDF